MKTRIAILCTLLVFMCIGNLPAQDVPFIWGHSWGVGSRAIGMGGAFTGVADDYSALYYNPAGLGQIKNMEVYGTLSYLGITDRATFIGVEDEINSSYTKLNALGISVPVPTRRGSLVFGFGFHQERDFERFYSASRFLSTPNDSVTWNHHTMIEGGLNIASLGGSMEMASGLYVGGSVNFWTGSIEDSWKFQEIDEPFDLWEFSDTTSTEHLETKFSGVNFTLAMLYNANNMVRFGAIIQTPVTLTANEDWDYYDIKTWDAGTPYEDSVDVASEAFSTDYKIRSPWVYRFGGSLNSGPILVSGEVEFYNYGQISYRTDPPVADQTQSEANIEIRENLKNVLNWRVGGEFTIPSTDLKLRGGYAVYPSPWKNYSDIQDRKVISFGGGFTFNKQFTLDVAYAYTSWDRFDYYVASSYNYDEYVEDQTFDTYKFLLTFAYRM